MKHDFNTPVLRQTAEEIQCAVRAKSVTADMVGGTLLALVNATGEMIDVLGELQREHVTVKVRAYDGTQGVSVEGAKVYVDMFCIGGVPTISIPRQELAVNDNGEVSFDVVKGYQYAVFSKLDGMGASFQFTYEACQDERTIDLWHFPIGVFMLGAVDYYSDDREEGREVPLISETYIDEMPQEMTHWDIRDDEFDEGYWLDKILVSTNETSFAIEGNSRSQEYKTWAGNRYYGKLVPTLPAYNGNVNDWEEMQAAARADYDGNLNTAKILSFCRSAQAAEFCANEQAHYLAQRFLPSAGQLYLIYLNKAAIDALMVAANANGMEFDVLTKDYNYYWSSTQYDEWCAWLVIVDSGGTYGNAKNSYYYVRAVSAFHFKY